MSQNLETTVSAEQRQAARAAYLKDALLEERWSARKLEARTGIPKSTIASRLSGATPLAFGDVEVFANVLKRDPLELFATLLKLPDLDSNQEPAG